MLVVMAWRNIWRHKARSLVIMMSITLGLLAGIAVLALYEGMLVSRIRTVIDEETGHIQLHHPNFSDENESKFIIGDTTEIFKILRNIPEIIQINKRTLVNGMMSTPTGTAGVQVFGIDTATEFSYSSLKQKIKEGNDLTSYKRNQVIIGKKLADKMKLKIGSKLVLMFNDTTNNLVSSAFRVSSIYQSTNAPVDERLIYVSGSELSELLGLPGQIHEIGLKLNDDKAVDLVASKLKSLLPNLKVETWKEISPETEFMVKTVDSYSYIILIIIMIALAFGILNTMLMAIMERTREIGMIAALGASRIRIFFLVLLETVFLTLGGAPLGLLIGWLLSVYFNKNGLNLSGMGEDVLSSFGFKVIIYPSFPAEKLLPVLIIVVVTALLSSIIPALKAINMKPIDALKN
ncbi:MAG: ABC transporter permease [Saprospiraceae bacterium]|nr:ABC transporter permease [Saprospiraceae bacterium]